MNWLARSFASALARRVAYVLVAVVLAYCGIGRASAQAQQCATSQAGCDEGQAYSACMSELSAYIASRAPTQHRKQRCEKTFPTSTTSITSRFEYLNGDVWIEGQYRTYAMNGSCAARASKVTPFFPPSGSVRCMSGCESVFRHNADDTSTYSPTGKLCNEKPDCAAQGKNMVWNAGLGVCQPVEPECPAGKVLVGNACTDEKPCPDGMALVNGSCKKKEEECPAGQIRSPLGSCIPGDNQCAAGEARGKDGTCKRDRDGDGKPDEGEEEGEGPDGEKVKESFSGGDDCDAPPSCSGSPVMCGQARIQWRIDCNTRRRVNISGGQCSQAGTPTCTGKECNAMEYSQLLMQWRSACAAEKLAAKDGDSTGTSPTDTNKNGVADVLEGQGDVTSPGNGSTDVASAKKWGIGVSSSMLDTSDMFGGGSCPQPPTIVIMGKSVGGSDIPYFCQLAAIMRALILVFGAYLALRILMGGGF